MKIFVILKGLEQIIQQCFVLLRTPYPSLLFLSVQGMSPTPLWHEESSDCIYLCVFCELFNLNSTYEIQRS